MYMSLRLFEENLKLKKKKKETLKHIPNNPGINLTGITLTILH